MREKLDARRAIRRGGRGGVGRRAAGDRGSRMTAFRFLTAGESHGPALGAIARGAARGRPDHRGADDRRATFAAGSAATAAAPGRPSSRIARRSSRRPPRTDDRLADPAARPEPRLGELDARDAGRSRSPTPRRPSSPRSPRTGEPRAQPVTRVRPGHADLAGALKYGFTDVRHVLERASARETAARVAAGAVARAFLAALGIEVWSFTAEVGGVALDPARCTRSRAETEASPLRCPDPEAEARDGRPDRRGAHPRQHGRRRVRGGRRTGSRSASGQSRPLGSPARRGHRGRGHEHPEREGRGVRARVRADPDGSARRSTTSSTGRDAAGAWIHRSNNAGGLTGGITNGEPLVVRGAVKPISTLARPLPSADLLTGEPVETAHYERSDISVVPAAGVIGEAMVMLTLADFVLEKFGGDSLAEVQRQPGALRDGSRAARSGGGRSAADPAPPVPRRRVPVVPRPSSDRASPAPAGTTGARRMDLVLVGLPGSGKTAVGRRLARRHGAAFFDLDDDDRGARRTPDPGHLRGGGRGRRSAPRAGRGRAPGRRGRAPRLARVIATGGGTPPWTRGIAGHLYRGRRSPGSTDRRRSSRQRLRRSPVVRPLLTGATPWRRSPTWRPLASACMRRRCTSTASRGPRVDRRDAGAAPRGRGRRRHDASCGRERRSGRWRSGTAWPTPPSRARSRRSTRAARSWSRSRGLGAAGARLAGAAARDGLDPVDRPASAGGEAAKRLPGRRRPARQLARLRAERADPIVAIGGRCPGRRGRLPGGHLAPRRPARPRADDARAQVDSSIGGKTAVDLPEGQEPRRRLPPARGDRRGRRRSSGRSPRASSAPRSARR